MGLVVYHGLVYGCMLSGLIRFGIDWAGWLMLIRRVGTSFGLDLLTSLEVLKD